MQVLYLIKIFQISFSFSDNVLSFFLGSVKLPKILDSLNIPIHNDLKIRNYDVLLDKDENITSIDIYCKSDKDANEIIDWSEPLTTDTLRVLESEVLKYYLVSFEYLVFKY